jgi:L-asparaginase
MRIIPNTNHNSQDSASTSITEQIAPPTSPSPTQGEGPSQPTSQAFRQRNLHLHPALEEPLQHKRPRLEKPIKNITILGTGGTIAGAAKSKTQTSGYKAGEKNIDELLREMIQDFNLPNHVKVSSRDVFQIDSKNITDNHWITLAKTVAQEIEKKDVHGVVITHGTDTLAATAFFLQMTVQTDKPIVVVGSMRPSTAISAEGPMNLNAAIRLAKSNKAKGNGVMVMANDKVFSASDVTKKHTTNVAAFQAENGGPIGMFANNKFYFQTKPARRHTRTSEFNAHALPTSLPLTYTFYSQVGQPKLTQHMIQHAIDQQVRGIIYAGTGDGTIHTEIENKLREVAAKGVLVIRASKTGAGPVVHNAAVQDEDAHVVSANIHNPDRAAILTKLALTQVPEQRIRYAAQLQRIQQIFKEY